MREIAESDFEGQSSKMKPVMSILLASFILAASAVVASYVVLLVGHVLPKLFANAYLIAPSSSDLVILMPPLTQFATRHTWVFALAIVLICVAVVLLFQRPGARVSPLVAIGLSAQALVVWFAMFCFCYDGFGGGMCLHHGPEFEFSQFMQFAFGVFPVTLCAIVVPGLFAFLSPNEWGT
jgi:hypothetical protein